MSTSTRRKKLNELRLKRINFIRALKDVVFISCGVVSAAFGLEGFLLPNNFLDGGVVGISLLTNVLTDIDLSYLLVIINLPFIIIGYTQVSKIFALKTLAAIVVLALLLNIVDFPAINLVPSHSFPVRCAGRPSLALVILVPIIEARPIPISEPLICTGTCRPVARVMT